MDPKEEIKARVNIQELISEYLPLKQAGAGSFKAICPFHAEKSPSFHVSSEKQIWHCFGCGKGGDCFAFLMEIEGMDFPEALRHLGAKVGVEVKRFSSEQSNDNQRLLGINALAGKFFEKVLSDATGAEAARAYVAKRGITPELVQKFGLGFAPDGWDTLVAFFLKRGFNGQEIERAGLALRRKSGDGWIDRFRNRLMVPLRNAHGEIVGFTGRVMPPATSPQLPAPDSGPKYMNSPETPIYHKGRLLFGLDLAKRAIKNAGCVVVVEGNLDVVASHKAGVEHVVASSGTALTAEQLDLLKRHTKTIVFSFDADAAGFSAAQRGIALARASGFDVRVAALPVEAGKDPDEAVQKDPELWRAAVGHTVPIMQYYIERAVAGRDLGNVDEKRAVSALLLPELALIHDVVEREHWLQTVADLLRTDMGVLRGAIGNAKVVKEMAPQGTRPPGDPLSKKPITQPPRPNDRSRPVGRAAPNTLNNTESAIRTLLGLFIHDADTRVEIAEALAPVTLPEGPLSFLYRELLAEYDAQRTDSAPAAQFFRRLRDRLERQPDTISLVPLLDELSLRTEESLALLPPKQARTHAKQLIDFLSATERERRRKAFEADIRRAEASGDREEVARLINEYNALR